MHTYTNLQLSAADLFKYVWPFLLPTVIKGLIVPWLIKVEIVLELDKLSTPDGLSNGKQSH